MSKIPIRKGLRGQSALVRSQFSKKRERKRATEYVEGCSDCRKQTKRWIVISETVMSSQIQRYHTEAAARQHYEGLANWSIVKKRTLAKLIEHDESEVA